MTKQTQRAVTFMLEGIDGAGKSLVMEQVLLRLRAGGLTTLAMQDPGSTTFGRAVRDWLSVNDGATSTHRLGRMTKFLLYQASRAQAEEEVLRPALATVDVVGFDRWLPSTEVYQHRIGGIPMATVNAIVTASSNFTTVDMPIYLRVSPEVAVERCQRRSGQSQRPGQLELSQRPGQLELSQRLVDAYDAMVATPHGGWQEDNWHTVYADQPLNFVIEDVYLLVMEALLASTL